MFVKFPTSPSLNKVEKAITRHCSTTCHRPQLGCSGCIFEEHSKSPTPILPVATRMKSFIELSQPSEREAGS